VEEPVAYKWGPGWTIALVIIGSFVVLQAYIAWRQGANYHLPTRDFLALAIVMGFFAIAIYVFLGKMNEGGDILLGALIAAFAAIVSMYFTNKNNSDE
jgi:Na+/H+-translocating membrane pyrophosphatase